MSKCTNFQLQQKKILSKIPWGNKVYQPKGRDPAKTHINIEENDSLSAHVAGKHTKSGARPSPPPFVWPALYTGTQGY